MGVATCPVPLASKPSILGGREESKNSLCWFVLPWLLCGSCITLRQFREAFRKLHFGDQADVGSQQRHPNPWGQMWQRCAHFCRCSFLLAAWWYQSNISHADTSGDGKTSLFALVKMPWAWEPSFFGQPVQWSECPGLGALLALQGHLASKCWVAMKWRLWSVLENKHLTNKLVDDSREAWRHCRLSLWQSFSCADRVI